MASVDQKRTEEHGGLSVARSDFASSLGRRLESIQTAILALEQQADSAARRDNLIRRLHALGASAKILGFAAATESLARVEQQLRTATVDTLGDDLAAVKGQLATLPTLVLRGTYSMAPAPPSAPPDRHSSPAPSAQSPWCVLVCGNQELADALRTAGAASAGFELVSTTEPSELRELCASYGPDAIVLDGTLPSLQHLLQGLKEQPETTDTVVIVAQPSDADAAALPELGVHTIVTSNLTPIALWRAVNRTRQDSYVLPPAREPFGDLDLRELFDRTSREMKRGLLEAADPDSQSMVIPFGDGTEIKAALWSALGRIREIVLAKSEGRVRFGSGPDGSVVLASSTTGRGRGRLQVDYSTINLNGRRVVVCDDDPAITWVVGGTLRAAGAEVREIHDGRSALTVVQQWWPELVISDVLMPGLDGFALCREIKRDVALRDVPVILLSWKEDLLFRLRELGADADGYLKKEANDSALMDSVRELLWPRISLERRLQSGQEVRGRLDGITSRTLLGLACNTGRNLRMALRDATSQYDIRISDRNLRAVTRSRVSGSSERAQSALAALLGVTAGRFSIIDDDQPFDAEFAEPTLESVLRTPILRARAAQRVLSGTNLANVEQLVLNPDAFSDELSLLPLSLRPIVDELLRGTTPGQLLATGATSLRALESLLSDAARRGAIRSLSGPAGEDLLTQEILVLSATTSQSPSPEPTPPPALFSFQLSPTPPPLRNAIESSSVASSSNASTSVNEVAVSKPEGVKISDVDDGFDWAAEASWDIEAPSEADTAVRTERSSPFSRPKFSAEWGAEKRTSPGVGGFSTAKKSPIAASLADPSPVEATAVQADTAAPHDVAHKTANEVAEPSQIVVADAPAPVEEPKPPQSPAKPGETEAAAAVITAEQQLPTAPNPAVEIRPLIEQAPQTAALAQSTPMAGQEPQKNPEDEAIFPLFPSTAPDKRSSPQNTPVPMANGEMPPCTTMPSQLAPRIEQEPPAKEAREDTTDVIALTNTANLQNSDSTLENSSDADSEDLPAQPSETADTSEQARVDDSPQKDTSRQWPVYLALAISTGVLSFFIAWPIVRALFPESPSPSIQQISEPVPTASDAPEPTPSLPSSTSSVAAEASSTNKEANPLPTNVTIAPDKGLVLVKTGGVHSIFVDDEFVGRGPERVVTLAPGVHKVRASLNGEEHTESVTAVAGRAVELSLERPGN